MSDRVDPRDAYASKKATEGCSKSLGSGGRSYIFENKQRSEGILGSENVNYQLLSKVFQ